LEAVLTLAVAVKVLVWLGHIGVTGAFLKRVVAKDPSKTVLAGSFPKVSVLAITAPVTFF
jgi:hypothetical protein